MEKRYSLWFIPSGDVYEKLLALIAEFSRTYSSPYFEPHVTLLGNLSGSQKDLEEKTGLLAASLPCFNIKLTSLAYSAEFYRSLFIKIEKDAFLMKANLEAGKTFSKSTNEPYDPHLSLIYGNLPAETKQEIILKLDKEVSLTFFATRLHLISTDGMVSDWRSLVSFDLQC